MSPFVQVSSVAAIVALAACAADTREAAAPDLAESPPAAASDLGTQAHLDHVMMSTACAGCHPAIYAEHSQNTHGRAYFDVEARQATRNFRREDCVRCHTPRPVFETGIGLTPMQRWTDMEEGNTCMSCHWKAGYDYSRFLGGKECGVAFDPRVGTVEACGSCHRIGGTPDQWSRAEHGSLAGNLCVDCHMKKVLRPVAVGEPPKMVRTHVFPGSRSASQLHRAYRYDVSIDGSDAVVKISNVGVGHNFPTASRQRGVESVVTVRDVKGNVIGRSRLVCRYPYASELAPEQMTMPVGTQIPSGKSREQRVPLPVAAGSVECELFFKLYRPASDYDPTLSRRLEDVWVPFEGIKPSADAITDAPFVGFPAPAAVLEDFLDPDGYANVARPAPGPQPVEIPAGRDAAEITRLVALLEFHLPEVRRRASETLKSLGPPAYPALIRALGSWSNESYNLAMELLAEIGEPALPALLDALQSDQLYVRCNARLTLITMEFPGDRAATRRALESGLRMGHPLDRRSAAQALGHLGDRGAAVLLRPLLDDKDWDVVSAAASALARLDDRAAAPAIRAALARARFPETRRDLARALGVLGDASGVPLLLEGLRHPDNLMRASFFDALFAVTGLHGSYDPEAPEGERAEAIGRLWDAWERTAGVDTLRRPREPSPSADARAHELMEQLGGGSDTVSGGDDAAILSELVDLGEDAVPALIDGLAFPSGFATKRACVCQALGQIGSRNAVPSLVAALRDPVPGVGEWACIALEAAGDAACLPALVRFEVQATGWKLDAARAADADRVLARSARTRLMLGDEAAKRALVALLYSPQPAARDVAIRALEDRYGDRRGYDPDADEGTRSEAAMRWMEAK